MTRNRFAPRACAGILLLLCSVVPQRAHALQWAGRNWNVTTGGMAGVAQGSASNVTVDADGYLHLKITKNGNAWTAAEIFTTDKLGFGTYQWQVDGPIDRFDKNIVLGLFPYGPAAGIGGDGTNEIDIEYSFWGNANGVNGDWTNYPASGTTIGEKSYKFSLNGGNYSTSRFIWSSTKIEDFLIKGFQPVGSTTDLIESWTYAPSNPKQNIPQQALPLGMNLWCFQGPPSDGKNVEVIVRSFTFVPEGSSVGGAAGAGGTSGVAGSSNGGSSSGGASAGSSSGGTGNATAGSNGSLAGASAAGAGAAGAGAAGASAAGAATAGSTSSGAAGGASAAGSSSSPSAGAPAQAGNGEAAAGEESGCSLSHRSGNGAWLATLFALGLLARRARR